MSITCNQEAGVVKIPNIYSQGAKDFGSRRLNACFQPGTRAPSLKEIKVICGFLSVPIYPSREALSCLSAASAHATGSSLLKDSDPFDIDF